MSLTMAAYTFSVTKNSSDIYSSTSNYDSLIEEITTPSGLKLFRFENYRDDQNYLIAPGYRYVNFNGQLLNPSWVDGVEPDSHYLSEFGTADTAYLGDINEEAEVIVQPPFSMNSHDYFINGAGNNDSIIYLQTKAEVSSLKYNTLGISLLSTLGGDLMISGLSQFEFLDHVICLPSGSATNNSFWAASYTEGPGSNPSRSTDNLDNTVVLRDYTFQENESIDFYNGVDLLVLSGIKSDTANLVSLDSSSWSLLQTNGDTVTFSNLEYIQFQDTAFALYDNGTKNEVPWNNYNLNSATSISQTCIPLNDGDASFSISGSPSIGEIISAIKNSDDPDGNGAFSYSWEASSDGTSWAAIGSREQLTIEAAQQGQQIRVSVNYTDAEGFSESVTTSAVSVAVPIVETGQNNNDDPDLSEVDADPSSTVNQDDNSDQPTEDTQTSDQPAEDTQSSDQPAEETDIFVEETESSAAQLITARLSGSVINLQFSKELKATNPTESKFTITASGKPIGVISTLTLASDGLVKVELDTNIQSNKSVELEYFDLEGDQTSGVIESADGVDVASFNTKVSNFTVDDIAPEVVEAVAEDTTVLVRFDEVLDQGSNADVKAWKLHENGKKVKIESTEIISETLIELGLSKSIDFDSNITLSYNDPSKDQEQGVVQDEGGNDLKTFKKITVENDTIPPAEPLTYSMIEVDGEELLMSFDKELSDTSPAKNSFRVFVNDKKNKVTQAEVFPDERSVVLTLSKPVSAKDSVTLTYTDAAGDNKNKVVEDEYGNDLEGFIQEPVKNNTGKANILAIDSAECDGDTIQIQLTDDIAATIPSPKRFKVKVDGKKQKITSVSTDAEEGIVTLNLKKEIEPGKEIILDYKALATDQRKGVVEDTDGNDLETTKAIVVSNDVLDETPPQLNDVFVEDNRLTIQFDEIISGGTLAKGKFKVKVDNKKAKILSAFIDEEESEVILELKPRAGIDAESEVLLSYTDPKKDQNAKIVQDLFGNDLATFRDVFVEIV